MKKIIIILSIAFSFTLNAQITLKNQLTSSNGSLLSYVKETSAILYDADVLTNATILGITEPRILRALSDLVITWKSYNATQSGFITFTNPDIKVNAMGAVWFAMGSTDDNKLRNFMNPSDTTFRLQAIASPTFKLTGIQLNGTSQALNTKVKPYTHMTNQNTQMSIYEIIDQTQGYNVRMGCTYDGTNLMLLYRSLNNPGNAVSYNQTFNNVTLNNAWVGDVSTYHRGEAVLNVSKIGTTLYGYMNGTGATSVYNCSITNVLDIPIYLGASYYQGGVNNPQKGTVRYASVGVGVVPALQVDYNQSLKDCIDRINPQVIGFGASIMNGTGASDPATKGWFNKMCIDNGFLGTNQGLDSRSLQDNITHTVDTAHTTYHVWSGEYAIKKKTRTYEYLIIADMGWNDIALRSLLDTARFETEFLDVINWCLSASPSGGNYNASDIYISNLPRGWNDYIPCTRAVWDSFQRTIKRVCATTGVNFRDIYKYMTDNDGVANLWNLQAGNVVHLNDVGNAAMAVYWYNNINWK